MQLVKYDAACRAIAEARSVDEIKNIIGVAEALKAAARVAKNRQLEIDAVEIRVRGERRLGELLLELRNDGQFGQGRGGRPIKLDDIGVDSNISGGCQRLAKLTASTFEKEISVWRESAPSALRLEMPLQRYRKPSIVGDRQRAAHKAARKTIHSDPLSRFVAPDGRKIADWRFGELERMKQLAERTIRCVDSLLAMMPIANPDPLDTMEMIFRDCTVLERVLVGAWDAARVQPGKTGVDDLRIERARSRRTRECKYCGEQFVMKRSAHKDRPSEGLFCSRSHAQAYRRRRST